MAGSRHAPVLRVLIGYVRVVPDVVVRPQLDERMERRMNRGKKPYPGVSRSWFEKGLLGVDGSGLYLVDADGVRHDLACPPNGALVRLMAYRITTVDPLYNFFVADEQHHRVVDLPEIGYSSVSGLDELAAAAGLRFEEAKVNLDRDSSKDYGYPFTTQDVDMRHACLAVAERRTLLHPFSRG